MTNQITVDPNLVNQAYKNMLTESQSQVATLQAAATQLQGRINELTAENAELKKVNQDLTAESGRQDGVPQDEEEAPAEVG